MNHTFPFQQLQDGLIVSCQAEGEDPFNTPGNLALFARAAWMGGAVGIRTREPANITAIGQAVDLPIIGITKSVFPDGSVLITPDTGSIDAIIEAGAHIIALDVTRRTRATGQTGPEFLREVRERTSLPLMADVATIDEGVAAFEAGADIVAPTLAGYTDYTEKKSDGAPDWFLLETLVSEIDGPVIMEGGIWTPLQARKALGLGAFAVVVGTAITRPRVITQEFCKAMHAPT